MKIHLSSIAKSITYFLLCIVFLATLSGELFARKSGRRSGSHHQSSSHHLSSYVGHRGTYSSGAQRDSHGRIKRSSSSKHEFMKETGYSHGRKGYVIDHVVPLSKGGSDSRSNMQWQTKDEAKAKDKWERGQDARKIKSKKHRH